MNARYFRKTVLLIQEKLNYFLCNSFYIRNMKKYSNQSNPNSNNKQPKLLFFKLIKMNRCHVSHYNTYSSHSSCHSIFAGAFSLTDVWYFVFPKAIVTKQSLVWFLPLVNNPEALWTKINRRIEYCGPKISFVFIPVTWTWVGIHIFEQIDHKFTIPILTKGLNKSGNEWFTIHLDCTEWWININLSPLTIDKNNVNWWDVYRTVNQLQTT